MKQFIKSNYILLLAFLLPIILIIIVAISTYLPSLFISTKYNFIYTSCVNNQSYYQNNCNSYLKSRYSVASEKIIINDIDQNQDLNKNNIPDYKEEYSDRLFLYDTEKNESREISIKEAQTLTINDLLTSPDGITISSSYDRRGGVFPFVFDGYSSYGYYLTKGKSKSKINLINSTDQYYYQNNFKFIGWILPGRN